MQNLIHVFIFVGSLQAYFFSLLVALKKNRSKSDWLLLALLMAMGTNQLLHYLRWEGYLELYIPQLLRVRFIFPAFIGPLFYLFMISLTGKVQRNKYNIMLLSPGIINFVLLLPYLLLSAEIKNELRFQDFAPVNYYTHYFVSRASLLFFSILAFLELNKPTNQKLSWLRKIALAMTINASILVIINLIDFLFYEITSYYFINIVNTVMIFVIGYFAISHGTVFLGKIEKDFASKYEKSSLSKEMANEILYQMDILMNDEHWYLKQNVSQDEIAKKLSTNTNHISQALNQVRKQKFSEYVNQFRIDAVKDRIADKAHEQFTLLAIAQECGFGSKASFNTLFKKHTGQTPSEYIKSIGSILQE
ncbi:helix-turn-helix domain-containing protein [Ekhidna sp.]